MKNFNAMLFTRNTYKTKESKKVENKKMETTYTRKVLCKISS